MEGLAAGGKKIYHGAIKRSLALWSYRTIKKGFSDLEFERPVMGGASNRNGESSPPCVEDQIRWNHSK